MATSFSNKQQGFLASILNWVKNQAIDQEHLLTFYSAVTKSAAVKHPKPPFPSEEESLAAIERQLASISADQATVAAHFGATPATPLALGKTARDDVLYTIVLWNVYLSGALKAMLSAEAGIVLPSPTSAHPPYPPADATLAWIVAWFDKSSSDLKKLLVRGGLAPGPTWTRPVKPFPSVDDSLGKIEVWGATITQDLVSVAMEAPRRGLGGKPQHPH